ncbi:type VI secretion system-associated FHA domain protein [Roseivivax sediminis]|uniref:FHA domain protein n=1 Tax=Roseivivax sediminis TaxID=936889 RepID=A0A1I1ZAP9_9RHOB|nr:type VI secretion system-associated FHA domain protein [Roseivivax sediminis]SFE28388.1 FHA domain protein [Roseivivax sediminis]
MTLTLRIEGHDELDNGSPASVVVSRSGLSAGRRRTMDWVLPDPERHISGHHFDIGFAEGAYWLTDLSTNGTFLAGQAQRIDGAHRLCDGDRLIVGRYAIAVSVVGAAREKAALRPSDIGPTPWPGEEEADWASRAAARPARPDPTPPEPAPSMAARPDPLDLDAGQPTQETTSEPQTDRPAGDDAVMRAFCEGAGLCHGGIDAVDAETLARLLGRTVRIMTEATMRQLSDRAEEPLFVRGGERAQPHARANNPLRVLPDADQAIAAMFVAPRDGFLLGPESFDAATADLAAHQRAAAAALRPALAETLSGLAPDMIEEEVRTGLPFSPARRSRAWDAYVAAWYARAKPGEAGMIEAVLEAYATAYGALAADAPPSQSTPRED